MLNKKFKALVHYVIHQCKDNPGRLGAVRLNKILWFTDSYAYQLNGTSVTGVKYLKYKMGPVPAVISDTLKELEKDEKIHIQEPEQKYDSRKYISRLEPDLSLLSEDECLLVQCVVDYVCNHTANLISEMTHNKVWKAAGNGEEIPMYTTLITERPELTNEIKEWAESVVQELQQPVQ